MSKNNVDTIVATIAHKMQLPTVTSRPVAEKKSGRGFVVQEPLREEPHVAFIGKSSMARVDTEVSFVATGDFKANRDDIPKVEVVQKPTEHTATVINETVVPASQVDIIMPSIETDLVASLPDITNLNKAISKVSNFIKDYLAIEGAFGQIKNGIHDKKLFEAGFYHKIQNCVYHSLRNFCGLTKGDDNVDIFPVLSSTDTSYLPTLLFFDRIFNHKAVSFEKDPNKVMERYRCMFPDADGIQAGWVESFKARVKFKMSLDDATIDKIAAIIMEEWGCRDISNNPDFSQTPVSFGEVETSVELQASPENDAVQHIIDNTNDAEEYEDDMEDIEEDGDETYLSVSIIREEDIDIVKVESSDGYGKVIIPFYTNLGDIDISDTIPSIVDSRNGKWDWLTNFVPDLMFRTRDPEKYLAGNDDGPEENKIKCVIMDESQGEYVIGVYFVSAITLYDREAEGIEDFSDDTVTMINQLVNMEVASGHMSHLNRSLSDPTLFRDEEYVLNHVMGEDEDEDDETETGCDHDVISDASLAALQSMVGVSVQEPVEDAAPLQEEDHQMDQEIVTIAGQIFPIEEEFTFQPIGKKQRLER